MKITKYFSLILIALAGCNDNAKESEATNVTDKSPEPVRIVAIGRVEPESKITAIGTEVNGVISKIYSVAGDSVKKGQLLLELKHEYEYARLAQTQSKGSSQQAEVKNVQAQIQSAKIKSTNLKNRFERIQRMLEGGAETQQSADNAKADLDQAEKEIDRLNASLLSAESKLNETAADAKVISVDIERRKIRAPSDGIILTMDLTEGSVVSTERALLDFAPLAPLTVLCEIDELWANKISMGQKAILRTQGTDEQLATGEVIYLSPFLKKKSLFSDDSSNMEDRRVREVRIRLVGNTNLLINSRVEAVINL